MAKKAMRVMAPTKAYFVTDKVGTKLGPYPVVTRSGRRVVILNDKQAKYYLTTGAISESAD